MAILGAWTASIESSGNKLHACRDHDGREVRLISRPFLPPHSESLSIYQNPPLPVHLQRTISLSLSFSTLHTLLYILYSTLHTYVKTGFPREQDQLHNPIHTYTHTFPKTPPRSSAKRESPYRTADEERGGRFRVREIKTSFGGCCGWRRLGG